jgi:hypothetical protein
LNEPVHLVESIACFAVGRGEAVGYLAYLVAVAIVDIVPGVAAAVELGCNELVGSVVGVGGDLGRCQALGVDQAVAQGIVLILEGGRNRTGVNSPGQAIEVIVSVSDGGDACAGDGAAKVSPMQGNVIPYGRSSRLQMDKLVCGNLNL